MSACVDPEKCISCGLCVATCPDVFEFNDDGVAEAVGDVTQENEELAKEAMENCPTCAILVE